MLGFVSEVTANDLLAGMCRKKYSCEVSLKFRKLKKQDDLVINLRPTTRECVHLVTRAHFRSRKKDGGYTIRFTNPMLHANFMAVCFIEPELLPTDYYRPKF